jgi:hypothetical protein
MDVEEFSEEALVDKYEYVVERNPAYESHKEEYEQEILEDDDRERYRKQIEQGIKSAQKHDNILTSAISAFLPGGEIAEETGWTFLGAEPLSELNVRNADAIFGNEDRNVATIVEVKGGISKPGAALEQLYDAAEALRENQDRVEEKIGMEIDAFECVICVPSYHDDQIIDQIESHQHEGDDRETVYVWRLHYLSTEEGERLDLVTRIDGREPSERTHDSQLSELLGEGVEITKERQFTPAFYPSSHLYVVMEEVFSLVLQKRVTDEGPIREFSRQDLLEELTAQRRLPHYDANTVGERLCEELLDRLLDYGLVSELDPTESDLDDAEECYRYRVNGRTMETILSNLKDEFEEAATDRKIECEAVRRTLAEYDERQQRLGDFGG